MNRIAAHIAIITLFFFCIFFLYPGKTSAEPLYRADIRAAEYFVREREMPTKPSLEFWVARYVGYNQIFQDTIKFPPLQQQSNQLEMATWIDMNRFIRDKYIPQTTEVGNKPGWSGSVCYYSSAGNGQILGDTIIYTEEAPAYLMKQFRLGMDWFAQRLALQHVKKSGGKYARAKQPIALDPSRQQSCSAVPPGESQGLYADQSKGINQFFTLNSLVLDALLNAICASCHTPFPSPFCPCVNTKMFVKTNSGIAYDTSLMCQGTGCEEKHLDVDPLSKATKDEQDSKGWINVYRPVTSIVDFIYNIVNDISGIMNKQQTKNNVNEPVADATWYTTKVDQVGMDFVNCKTFPRLLHNPSYEYFPNDECSRDWTVKRNPTPQPTQIIVSTGTPTPSPAETPKPTISITPSTSGLHGKCEGNMPATADAFITYLKDHGIYWPDWDNVRAHYDEIMRYSKAKGIDPGIAMAIWVEESGAGRAGPQFGCTSIDPSFYPQLNCFLNLWDTYATDSRFEECRGSDNTLSTREFMLIYEGGYKSCRSGEFGTEPTFPDKLKNWYDQLTDCQNGLEF